MKQNSLLDSLFSFLGQHHNLKKRNVVLLSPGKCMVKIKTVWQYGKRLRTIDRLKCFFRFQLNRWNKLFKFSRKNISHKFFDIIKQRMMMFSIRIMRLISFSRNLIIKRNINLFDRLSCCIIECLIFLVIWFHVYTL